MQATILVAVAVLFIVLSTAQQPTNIPSDGGATTVYGTMILSGKWLGGLSDTVKQTLLKNALRTDISTLVMHSVNKVIVPSFAIVAGGLSLSFELIAYQHADGAAAVQTALSQVLGSGAWLPYARAFYVSHTNSSGEAVVLSEGNARNSETLDNVCGSSIAYSDCVLLLASLAVIAVFIAGTVLYVVFCRARGPHVHEKLGVLPERPSGEVIKHATESSKRTKVKGEQSKSGISDRSRSELDRSKSEIERSRSEASRTDASRV